VAGPAQSLRTSGIATFIPLVGALGLFRRGRRIDRAAFVAHLAVRPACGLCAGEQGAI